MGERYLFIWKEVKLLCGVAEKEKKHWTDFTSRSCQYLFGPRRITYFVGSFQQRLRENSITCHRYMARLGCGWPKMHSTKTMDKAKQIRQNAQIEGNESHFNPKKKKKTFRKKSNSISELFGKMTNDVYQLIVAMMTTVYLHLISTKHKSMWDNHHTHSWPLEMDKGDVMFKGCMINVLPGLLM